MSKDDFATFGGSLTADVVSLKMPESYTLGIHMTRGEHHIADELRGAFGSFNRVVIDVDGEQHEFRADSFIRLLEGYEGARDTSRHAELFGTPERAARTLAMSCYGATSDACETCVNADCDGTLRNKPVFSAVYDALVEWLREEAE